MPATIADLRERFDAFADPVAYPDPVVERAIIQAAAEFALNDDGALALAARIFWRSSENRSGRRTVAPG